jgi:hypothetical protein
MPHSVIVREGETRPAAPASGTARPAPAAVPGPPLPADATGPIAYRERASSFSLTGRHRLEAVPDNGREPGRSYGMPADAPDDPWATPVSPPATAGPARGPWEPAQPAPSEPAAPPQPAAPPAPGPGLARRQPSPAAGTHRGLPRRVRQASIAPQLREQARAEPAAASRLADGGTEARSPEETRSLLSALQQGWQRGRVDDLDYPGDGPDGWPGGRPGGSPDSNDGEGL